MTQRYPVITRARRNGPGLAARPLRAPWPGGARTVAAITLNFDGASWDITQNCRPLGARSQGLYAGRIGVRRQLDILDSHGIKGSFMVPGYDAECFPDLIREIVARGHEVAAHGYLHERVLFSPEEEEKRLRHTHEILTRITGKAPVGWRSPSGQKTYTTLRVLKDLGYRYDASEKDADMPHMLDLGDGLSMAEVPNNATSLDDFPWFQHSRTPVSEVRDAWIAEFDTLHADRGYFMLGIHSRAGWGSGTPSRAAALDALIRHIKRFPGIAFVTAGQVADWVLANPTEFDEVRI